MAPTLLFILLVQVSTITIITCNNATLPKFSAILIFGDSLLDTGNNNFIPTVFKANHLPYGENFPGRVPTGRFSDGKLVSDFMASALGIKETVPAFLDPNLSDDDIRTGVCFASAGAGYDDLTSAAFRVIPVSNQTQYFRSYIEKLKGVVGKEKAKNIINGSFVLVTSGSNDIAFNYFLTPTRRFQFSLVGYQDFLHQRIRDFIKVLYSLGCRNMAIAGLPPLGCGTVRFSMFRTCLDVTNLEAQSYNQKLLAMLPQIQASLPGSKLVYADIYTPMVDMINNPQKYGFVVTNRGCCGTGFVEVGPLCNPLTPICRNASQFIFFDAIHPTESAYRHISQYFSDTVLPQFL